MEIDNNGILIGKKSTTIGAEFHETRGKSALLRSLVDNPLHQINWETPYYNKFIDECLDGEELSEKVCLDLGCSDGRFTEYLINKGVKKVICLDVKQLICDMQKEYNYYLRNGSRRPCHVGEVVAEGLYGVADTDDDGHFRERS